MHGTITWKYDYHKLGCHLVMKYNYLTHYDGLMPVVKLCFNVHNTYYNFSIKHMLLHLRLCCQIMCSNACNKVDKLRVWTTTSAKSGHNAENALINWMWQHGFKYFLSKLIKIHKWTCRTRSWEIMKIMWDTFDYLSLY